MYLLPWQRDLLARVLERDPATGEYVHRRVVLTVPRFTPRTLADAWVCGTCGRSWPVPSLARACEKRH